MKESVFFEFEAEFPEYGAEEIHNAEYLANTLSTHLTKNGVTILEQDIWKDCGWSVYCTYKGEEIWLFFAKYFDDEEWQFTIEPFDYPRLILRLFGRKAKPYKKALKFISNSTFEVLSQLVEVSKLKISLASNTSQEVNHINKLKW